MRLIGLHIRLHESLLEVVQRADTLSLSTLQCFFVDQTHKKLLKPDAHIIEEFARLRQTMPKIFVHGSYWINLASLKRSGASSLQRELRLAQKLNCTHLIVHPGAASGAEKKMQGIDQMAQLINQAHKKDNPVRIVLENTTHGNLTVGSDITDFQILKTKLDYPERVGFCIDTAHAFSYGYDIKDQQEQFITFLDNTIGLGSIDVLHINDSYEPLGSRIDKHAPIGEGLIGEQALRNFSLHPKLQHIPLILELPLVTEQEERAMVMKVQNWHR